MTEWKTKRFWDAAHVVAIETGAGGSGGFGVNLDDRPLNTPGRLPLVLPTRAMAAAVAAEWNAQDGAIKPLSMPHTRSANSAVERVRPQHRGVADMLAAYGETDLICYRAEGPPELVAAQAAQWDPLLDWADGRYGARLMVGAGIVPVTQPAAAIASLRDAVHAFDPFALTALHDLITLSGSLILGLAVADAHVSAEAAWPISRIDEDWQIAQWGEDAEAMAAADAKRAQFLHADEFLRLGFAN